MQETPLRETPLRRRGVIRGIACEQPPIYRRFRYSPRATARSAGCPAQEPGRVPWLILRLVVERHQRLDVRAVVLIQHPGVIVERPTLFVDLRVRTGGASGCALASRSASWQRKDTQP